MFKLQAQTMNQFLNNEWTDVTIGLPTFEYWQSLAIKMLKAFVAVNCRILEDGEIVWQCRFDEITN